MASSWSEENVNLNYFQHWRCQSVGMSCNFLDIRWVSGTNLPMFTYGRCCCHFLWLMLLPLFDLERCYCHVWLMLLPLCGWCYFHFLMLANVIAMFGWCYCHIFVYWWHKLCYCGCCYATLWECIFLADLVARFGWCCWHLFLCLADGAIPFLDILITPKDDGSLQTSVYRKPTHTDLYLQWDSHHTIPSKYSVVGTLYHRAKTICSNQEMLLKEEQHLFQALRKCKYPNWALNRVKLRCQNPSKKQKNTNQRKQNNQFRKNLYMVVPYYKGLSKSIKRSCNKFGVQVHFKGGLTIKDLLMAPKDKDHILKKSGVIYKYTCNKVECDEEYIGESARLFAERFKEHQKAPSPIHDHSIRSGHEVNIDNFSIVGREDQNLTRTIKEALYIRVNNPSLNKNIGKYHLPHIWDEVLCNSPELKLK